ncbi:MAG: acetate--CoA ligase family protein, partial [Steroidobacteraceae bacterium]
AETAARLTDILGGHVALANPFDFQTGSWFDRPRLRAMFAAAQRAGYDLVGFMIDCPPPAEADAAAYLNAIEEFTQALPGAPARGAVISSLPESLPAPTRERCLAAGVVPLQGQRAALEAVDLAGGVGMAWERGPEVALLRPQRVRDAARSLAEHDSKAALAAHGVRVPRSAVVWPQDAAAAAQALGFPVVIKATGAALEHKSESGGVLLNITSAAQASDAARRLSRLSERLLIEEMVSDGVAEVLVGISVDPQFGQLMVLGAGGVLTELLRDTVTLLPPFTAPAIAAALPRLKVWKLLTGFRGRPAADVGALIDTALACARYAEANLESLVELDINPVIVRPVGSGAVAVDALIRLAEER